MCHITQRNGRSEQILQLIFWGDSRGQRCHDLDASFSIVFRQELNWIIHADSDGGLSDSFVDVAQMGANRIEQFLPVQQGNMLTGLVLEEVAYGAQREHDEILRVLRVWDKSDQRLNVGHSSVTAGESLVACWMQQVDAVQIHHWEKFVHWESKQLVNDFELLWWNFRSVVVLWRTQHVAQGLKVDQILTLKDV